MLSLDALLAPITLEAFQAEHDDQRPLHIPATAGAPKRALLDWAGFNALLAQSAIWSPQTLKLLFNGQRVPPPQYCRQVRTGAGTVSRPSPAKVNVLLAQGASLVIDEAQDLHPAIDQLAAPLARAFAGQVSANLYCSFGGVQAFGTHFDLHHVFAVQTEGEKIWTLYQNRADAPVYFPFDSDETRRWLAQTRGAVMERVHMRPGDVLYLPRGWYHDALTTEGASLHVTFSVTPAHGPTVFKLLQDAAMQDPAFRTWLRPAVENEGEALKLQLADLGRRLAGLMATDDLFDEVAMAQERLAPGHTAYDLPHRVALTMFRPTGAQAPAIRGPARHAIDWALSQPRLALEELIAQFDFVPEAEIRAAVAEAERTGALVRG